MTDTRKPVESLLTDYDIFEPGFVANPYPGYSEIRESECPIARTERYEGSWLPTRYEDVVALAQEYEIFTSRGILVMPPPPGQAEGAYGGVAAPPITSDPPDHHWHRRLILPVFAPQAVAKYEQSTRDLCNALIDEFIDKGTADAAADYAQHIPVRVISNMLGVPLDMEETFTGWVRGVLENMTDMELRKRSRLAIIEYFLAQVEDRKKNPGDDLVSKLVVAAEDGSGMDDEHVVGNALLLLVGGNETTRNVITGGLEAMIRNPEQMALARRSPEDLERAIEECLRWVTPIINMVRVTTEDVEIRGVKIPKGSQVIMNYTAANRDEDMFVEPHTFDVTRSPNPHIAFGWGPHLCLGASLARLELRSIYTELFKRTDTIEFADPNYQPVYSHASFVRGIQSLPVKFG